MADVLDQICELTEKIRKYQENFKRQGLLLRTTKYIHGRQALLTEVYQKFQNLPNSDSSLVAVAVEKFIQTYQDYQKALDNITPVDRHFLNRSHSVSDLDDSTQPESLDTLKLQLYGSRNNLSQLTRNIHDLTNQLALELNIEAADLDIYESEAEKLDFVLTKNSEIRKESETRHTNELAELKEIIQDQARKIKTLEEEIEIAEASDEKSLSDFNEQTNKEKIYLERINNLNQEIAELKKTNLIIDNNISENIQLIIKLQQKIQTVEAEKKLTLEKFESLEKRIAGNLTANGRNNYSLLVKNLYREIDELKKNNPEIKILENRLKTLILENCNLREIIVKMEDYERIVKSMQTIPNFSGERSSTLASDLRQFIKCCELVYNKITQNDRPQFMEILYIKLSGDAADLVNNVTFENLDQFKDLLTKAYIPKKNSQTLTDELKRAMQRPGERIQEFGLRITKLLLNCQAEAKLEYAQDAAGVLISIEKDAIKAYKLGIISNAIKYHLMTVKLDKLEKVIEIAEGIDAEEEQLKWTPEFKDTTFVNSNNFVTKPAFLMKNQYNGAARDPNSNQGPMYNKFTNFNRNSRPNNYNRGQNNNYHRGHVQNSSNPFRRNTSNIKCFKCGRSGHLFSECRGRPENIFCSNCRKYGHQTKDCRQRQNVAVINSDEQICRFCRRTDHLIDECLYKKEYERESSALMTSGNDQGASTDTVRPQ